MLDVMDEWRECRWRGMYSIEDIHMQEYEYDMSLNATASVRAVQRYDGIGTV